MANKVCVVTGGAGSLGLAAAAQLLAAGAKVLLVDREQPALDAALRTLNAGAAAKAHAADVADSTATRAYLDAATGAWGSIDVLFSNAGVSGVVRPVTEYPEEVFDQVMAVNVRASFLACKYGLPKMSDGGSIIITASVVGVTSGAGICAYATSKHAVIGLMRTVALEAAARRIRVNVVAPGPVDNAFQKRIEDGITAATGRDGTAMLDGIIPLRRHARAEEIARTVLFLASDQSSFSTGSVFMADGGMHV
jgi:NAD(P)-dependent dehydrogenase (short-subunit alcohol dehydrogenase family)